MDQHGLVTERKTPIEQALDLFFYAPLGLLMNAEEIVPQLAERGRKQVKMAKMMGQYTVKKGQAEAEKALIRLQDLAEQPGPSRGTRRRRPRTASRTPPSPTPAAGRADRSTTARLRPRWPSPTTTASRPRRWCPRLESLSGAELDAVRGVRVVEPRAQDDPEQDRPAASVGPGGLTVVEGRSSRDAVTTWREIAELARARRSRSCRRRRAARSGRGARAEVEPLDESVASRDR